MSTKIGSRQASHQTSGKLGLSTYMLILPPRYSAPSSVACLEKLRSIGLLH